MELSRCNVLCVLVAAAAIVTNTVEAFAPHCAFSSRSMQQISRQQPESRLLAAAEGNDTPESTMADVIESMTAISSTSRKNEDDDDDMMFDDEEESVEEDYIVKVGELEGEGVDDDDVGSEDNGELPGWAESEMRMQEMREKYRRHDNDTGSPEYQVAGMTERISYLTRHLQVHPKDFSTRRGLVAMVNKRRRLLNYLFREDVERYKALVASLGIRHKAPGRVPDRAEQYGRFPKQKAIKKHLVKKN